ncbi:MAG: YraN family protein [Firmicutes bacterium]|nr:YraN family protein [Bacillota bacterium]
MNNISKGKAGEALAAGYLKKHKYKILDTNFKTKLGEIDIVALDKSNKKMPYVVFVEIKTRASNIYGLPSEAVNISKQKKLTLVAEQYILKNKLFYGLMRFDVIEVVENDIRHIKNAFDALYD